MNIILLIFGLVLPSLPGWLALRLCEGKYPVLHPAERIVWAAIVGPTLCILSSWALFSLGLSPISRAGFIVPWILLTIFLGGIGWYKGVLLKKNGPAVVLAPAGKPTRKQLIVLAIVILWTGLKLASGAYDLVSTPTYWDDSFNNWNMRGKIIFITKDLNLHLENEALQLSGKAGTNSYPPTVSLFKTWLATVKGSWDDSLVNSIHSVWLLLLLAAFFWTLRRFTSVFISVTGVYALASLPLLLIHGSNPYADVFEAMHLFITVTCLLAAASTDDQAAFRRWMLLFGFCAALLTFTKNEGTALYLPLCTVASCWIFSAKVLRGVISLKEAIHALLPAAFLFAVLAAPWSMYKIFNHLSFGNAKYLSDLSISFHADALQAIWFQLHQEANFLLLPLLIVVTCILAWRRIFLLPYGVLSFIGLVGAALQIGIFLFTPLATEAVMQTGLARGMAQIAPILLLLVILLWHDMWVETKES